MGRLGSILIVAVIIIFAYSYFFKKSESAGVSTPASTIDSVGAKNDILAIAQAERLYQAEHGSYTSLDELNSSGALSVAKTGRAGYHYEVETSDGAFRVIARCEVSGMPCNSYSVDQTMEVHAEP